MCLFISGGCILIVGGMCCKMLYDLLGHTNFEVCLSSNIVWVSIGVLLSLAVVLMWSVAILCCKKQNPSSVGTILLIPIVFIALWEISGAGFFIYSVIAGDCVSSQVWEITLLILSAISVAGCCRLPSFS